MKKLNKIFGGGILDAKAKQTGEKSNRSAILTPFRLDNPRKWR